jgi:hypothetical protein
LVALQNPEDCEEAQGVFSEICPASSHDNSANSTEVEELSAAEKDVGPAPVLFPGIETESEVSSVSCLHIVGFHNCKDPLFCETQFKNFTVVNNLCL